MRRALFVTPVLAALAFVPRFVFAQDVFGPIVPQSGVCTCPGSAPDWGCILRIVQNGLNVAIAVATVVIVLAIIYAGFVFMTAGANANKRSEGKNIMLNSVIGLLIMLAAYIGVDFVMKAVYNPSATFEGQNLGPWNAIWAPSADDMCLLVNRNPLPITTGTLGIITGASWWSSSAATSLGSGDCSPDRIRAAAASGGYQLTQAQAETFSCLAREESSCGTNITGATTPGGAPTTAHGMFQIVLGLNDTCHNLNIPVCTQAANRAGHRISGNLNCSQAFERGRVKRGKEALAAACQAASRSLDCNASAAACLLQRRPDFGDWTADARSSGQRACIMRYSR